MSFLAKLPAYAPFLFWATILLALVTTFFVVNGMRVNRGELISGDPPTFAAGSLVALVLAALGLLMDPLIWLWIAFVAGLMGTWGAVVDTNRLTSQVGERKAKRRVPGADR